MARKIKNISKSNRVRHSVDVMFGDVIYEPRGTFGPRIQADYQLVVIHEGEALISVDDVKHHLPQGRVALLKPAHREYFEFSRDSSTHHTWCAVNPRRVSKSLSTELEAMPFSLPLTQRMHSLIELGLSSPVANSPMTAALIDKLGDTMLQEYLAQATLGGEETTLLPKAVWRAKEMIETNFASPLSMKTLARAACCTPNHLGKLFRQHLHVTPSRYLWQTRVSRGVELLRQTGLSISEIAYRTGFQTPFHFSRLVKQQHKLSPRALKIRMWGTPPK